MEGVIVWEDKPQERESASGKRHVSNVRQWILRNASGVLGSFRRKSQAIHHAKKYGVRLFAIQGNSPLPF